MVKVKICGITNLEDALVSVNAGSDALGFVFYKKSPRYIDPEKAKDIIRQLPKYVIKIGIFVNSREKRIKRIAKICELDMLQFHGSESPDFCERFGRYKVIKAFRIKNNVDYRNILRYKVFALLFDTFSPLKLGGTGRSFDWKLISHIRNIKRPIFLSGGLAAKNVKSAISAVFPDWIDVSSSVEDKPGKKNHKEVKKLIRTAKSV